MAGASPHEIPSPPPVPDHAEVVMMPSVAYAVAAIAGLLTQGAIGGSLLEDPWVRNVLGIMALELGLIGAVLFARHFEGSGQERDPLTPTTAIVTDGVYARSRNPAHVSLTLVYLGLALLLDNVWMLLFLAPVLVLMHYGVVLREERYLELKFGEEYLDYKSKVRRYL